MPTAIHSFSAEEVMAYLDGELSATRSVAVAQHLEECGECQNLASELRGVSQNLVEWLVEVTDAVAPKPTEEARVRPRPAWWRRPAAIIFAAATVLIVVGITARMQRPVPLMDRAEPASRPSPVVESADEIISDPSASQTRLFVKNLGRRDASRAAAASGPLIVRTAQLTLTSKDFEGIRAGIERIAKKHHGYIGQLDLNTTAGSSRSLSASLQVPAPQLDSVIGELKQLGHVNSESQSGEDVTQRSVDLDARLANLQMTETRLQQLLRDRTGKLGEVLEVEEAVDRVRGEIETAEAERKSLSNQISFATLRLSVSEEYKAQLENNGGSVVTRLRNSAVEGYQDAVEGVISALVFLLSIGPTLLIIIGIGLFPALWIWRRLQRHRMARAA